MRARRSNVLKNHEEQYLIVLGHAGKNKKQTDPFVRFHAYLFDTNGYLIWDQLSENIQTFTVQ